MSLRWNVKSFWTSAKIKSYSFNRKNIGYCFLQLSRSPGDLFYKQQHSKLMVIQIKGTQFKYVADTRELTLTWLVLEKISNYNCQYATQWKSPNNM